MRESGPKGLSLINAKLEPCHVDEETLMLDADYVAEVSGELPCNKASNNDKSVGEMLSPYIKTADQIDIQAWIERLKCFSEMLDEWNEKKSIAFQLLIEGNINYVPIALDNKMGEYDYQCDNDLKTLHCLQEVVHEESSYLFYPTDEDTTIRNLLSILSTIDRTELHRFVADKIGINTLFDNYKKCLEIFSAFMRIYPNILPAETYLRFKNPDSSLVIATCSFEDVKYFYQDAYESLLSIIHIVVCLDNILIRKDYSVFSNAIHSAVNKPSFRGSGSDYDMFEGMDKGYKVKYLSNVEPVLNALQLSVNKDLRNGIGHNNYVYDGILQQITIHDRNGNTKLQKSLMDIALDCIGMARSSVIMGEIILFIIRQEYHSSGACSAIHPRFYKNTERNDSCPCGSGVKFKNCCMNDITKMISKQKEIL